MNRQRFIYRSSFCAVLIGLALATGWVGPRAWGYFLYTHRVRSLQRACLNYSGAVGEIVYDSDPGDRAKLLSSAREYRAFNDWAVFRVPAVWHDFRGSYDCPDGTAFLHERVSASGHRRLVAVDLIPVGKDAVELRGSVVTVAPRFDLEKLEGCRRAMGKPGDAWTAKAGGHVRIYAGQVDTLDPSRFVIPADFGEGMFQIRCQLLDDDSVRIEKVTG